MLIMKLSIGFLLLILGITTSIQALPLWLRYPAISPDGAKIAFTYKGCIFVISTQGENIAQPITSGESYACYPVFARFENFGLRQRSVR